MVRQRVHLRRQLPVQLPVQHLRQPDAATLHLRHPGPRSSPTCRPSRCWAATTRPGPAGGLSLVRTAAAAAGCRPPPPALVWRAGAPAVRRSAAPRGRSSSTFATCAASSSYAGKPAGCAGPRTSSRAVDGVSFTIEPGRAASATSAPTARASRRPSRCSPASSCRPRARCGSAARPGPAPHRAGPPDRRGFRPAQPALVGPAAADSFRLLGSTGCRRRTGEPRSTIRRVSTWRRSSTPRSPAVSGRAYARRGRRGAASRPRVLFLDEPTIGLDLREQERCAASWRADPRARHHRLLTTHDLRTSSGSADRLLVIDHGRVAFDGTLPGPGHPSRRGAGARRRPRRTRPAAAPASRAPACARSRPTGCASTSSFRQEETTAAAVVAAGVIPGRAARPGRDRVPDRSVVRRLYAG